MKNLIIVLVLAFVFASCGENEPPSTPSNPYPQNNSRVPTNVNFSWTCDDPDVDKLEYSIYIDGVLMPPNLDQPFYSTNLMPGKTYSWFVIARDKEHSVQGPTWFFFTESIKKETVILADETVKIDAGTYKKWAIYGNSGDKIHYEIKTNLDVNVWFMDADELDNFTNDKFFKQYPEYSAQNVYTLSKDFTMWATGFYYLVIDNTFSFLTPKTVYIKITVG